MSDFFSRLFDPSGFVPRRVCGEWTPGLVWLHNASDALIWLAYLAIPLVLLIIARRRNDVPFKAVYFLFIAFILTCGFTHFLDVVMFYTPLYRLSGLVKAMTAVASWATVLALVPVLPKALAMRSPEELQREIAERRKVEGELRALHAELEERVELRTAELENAVVALQAENEERKRFEQLLWASREQLRLVTDNVPVMLVHCDTERRYKFVNRAYAACFGLPPREIVGKTISEVVGERAYERIRANVDAALAGERVEREVEGPYEGTEKRWLHFTCLPTYSQSGEVDGAIAVILDVTDHRKAEELLHSITDTVPALLAYVDVEGRYRLNNLAYERWFGQPRSEMTGRHMSEVLGNAAWLVIEPNIEAALAGQSVHFEYPIPYRSGGMRWVEAAYTPHLDLGGAIDGVVVLVNDVTARRSAETSLRQSESLFRQLANAMPQIVWMAGPDGRVDYLNEWWYEYTGQPRAGSTDESWKPILHPEDVLSTFEAWEAAVRSGGNYEIEHRFKKGSTGEYRWHMGRAVPVRDDAGEIVRWFGTSTDVHDKKLAEEKLKESERTYRAIGESIDYGVWVCAPDGTNTYASPSFPKLVGITQEQCSEFGWGDILHPDEVEGTIRAWKECVRVRGKWDREHRCRGVDGQYHPVLARGAPVEDEQGKLLCWAGINLDISHQKRVEQELKELNASLERRVAEGMATAETGRRTLDAVLDSLPIAVIISDPDGRLVRLNKAHERIWGVAPMSISTDEYGDWVGYWPATGKRVQAQEWALSRSLLNAEVCPGELVEIEQFGSRDRKFIINSAAPVRGPDGDIIAGVVASMDVTDRIQAEAALRESEVRFHSAFDHAPIGMALVAPDGRWMQVNRSLCELVGYTEQELLATDFQTLTHPDDLDADLGHVRELLSGASRSYQMEKRYFHKRGHVVYIHLSVSLVRNVNGEPLSFVTQIKDVTEQKMIEGKVSASLREKEVLLKEIHHRVKNNLQIVSALLDLQSGHATDPAVLKMFQETQGRVKSMALIHERLYRSHDMANVDFSDYARQLTSDLYLTYKVSNDDIRLELDVDIPALPIDTAIPVGLLLNELISNCFKHAFADAAGGVLRVSLLREGGVNILTVADNGVGFPAAADFRHTTSFGLELVNTLVDQLDGEISMSVDGGTAFTVRFPKPSSIPTGARP